MEELASRFPEHQKLIDGEVICKFMSWAAKKGLCLGRVLRGKHDAKAWPCDLTINVEAVMDDYQKFDKAAFERESAEMLALLELQQEATFRGRN